MIQLAASALAFACGVLLLPIFVPRVEVRDLGGAFAAGLLGGIASAAFGRLLFVLLSLIIWPIGWMGGVGAFLVQLALNLGIVVALDLRVASLRVPGVRTATAAALALTSLQLLVRLAG